jgi:WD40 repeat protein
VKDIRVSRDGTRLLTSSADGSARVIDLASGKILATLTVNTGVRVQRSFFSPDGRRVTTLSDDGVARVWKIETRELVGELRLNDREILDAILVPDGKSLIATADNEVVVWSVFPTTDALVRYARTRLPDLTPMQRAEFFLE